MITPEQIVATTGAPIWVAQGMSGLIPGGAGTWYEPDTSYDRGTDWRAEASHLGLRIMRTTRWFVGQQAEFGHEHGA